MRRLFIIIALTLGLMAASPCVADAQSGWSTGNYYAYKGGSTIESVWNTEYNQFCNCYVNVRYCRQLNWYSEWYSGYIYVWGPNGWYSEWKQGNYWYCTWSNWWAC